MNYALPDMSTTTPENFRQNGAGSWEEIGYIHTDHRNSPPLSHARIIHTISFFQFFIPKPLASLGAWIIIIIIIIIMKKKIKTFLV